MLTQYRLFLQPDNPSLIRAEWGYPLYADLLSRAGNSIGERWHQDSVTPISQYLRGTQGGCLWTVNLLGEESEAALSGILENIEQFTLHHAGITLTVQERTKRSVSDVDTLFSLARQGHGRHRLLFHTATAFRSKGNYQNLPTTQFLLQSLIQKWNGCLSDCPIEDEDDKGVKTLTRGLFFRRFHLTEQDYILKRTTIPGFVGDILLENNLSGFHYHLMEALLLFSDFSGVGIKTTLGMGGVEHRTQ